MKEPLVIVGAGGFAREAADAVGAINSLDPRWDLLGFLDDDRSLAGCRIDGAVVLGPIDEALERFASARVVVCTGRPDNYFSRASIVSRLEIPEERFATIVHPQSSLAPGADLGPGTVVLAGVVMTTAVEVAAHVAVMPGCTLTHDDVIGEFATLASGVRLGGGVAVGRGTYVGAGALVRENVRLGDWSLIGMGSLVLRDVPSAEVWFGSPARCHGAVAVPAHLEAPVRWPRQGEGPVVHPLGLCESAEVGDRTRVWAFAHVMAGAVVGADCNLGDHSFVENGAMIGDRVTVKNGVAVWEGVTVEDDAFVGPYVTFTNDLRPRSRRKAPVVPTRIGRGASLGANATIVCGVSVGAHAFVAAGAVVTNDVADHALVAGIPARQVGWVCECGKKLRPSLACGCGRAYDLDGSSVLVRRGPAGTVPHRSRASSSQGRREAARI